MKNASGTNPPGKPFYSFTQSLGRDSASGFEALGASVDEGGKIG
jgi:hypothetical protein